MTGQLLLFALPPAPLQLALELVAPTPPTTTTKCPTMKHPSFLARLLLNHRRRRDQRFGGAARPLPSSTTEFTPDDWRVIRGALQRSVVDHTAADRWPAAEAAQRTLDKVAAVSRTASPNNKSQQQVSTTTRRNIMEQPDHTLTNLVDTNVFVRTVTHYHVGTVVAVTPGFLTLDDCSWVADTGRFGVALATGALNEVERFPSSVHVAVGAIIDITAWTHPLPTVSK